MSNATVSGKKSGRSKASKGEAALGTNRVQTPHGELEIKGGGEQKKFWNLLDDRRNEDHQRMIAEAVANKFIDYVDGQEASKYVMDFLGFINPRIVINLSRNLRRKLTLSEVWFLGGSDGVGQVTCKIFGTKFQPNWGLDFRHNGVLVHILNQMNAGRPLGEALCMTQMGDVVLLGNNMHINVLDTNETTHMVLDGAPWSVCSSGEIWKYSRSMGEVHKGLVEKEQNGQKAKWWCSAINTTLNDLLMETRKEIAERKTRARDQKRDTVRGVLDTLFLKG